ncbi:TPA: hypothetical protein DDW35_02270 [Candidatus Sumerlaeota bacterium]|nr:hypothetical protein [Candidatus Sumerlaeota bacterium]
MLRIGFNALCAENKSGTGRYAAQLILALARLDRQNEYFVCVRSDSPLRELLAPFDNVHIFPVVTQNVFQRILFERFRLPSWIRKNKLSLFHSPAFIAPGICPAPSVVTIHDLVFHLFPNTVPALRRIYYNRAIPFSIRNAALLLADSESSARDLSRVFRVPMEKIRVTHLGVSESFFQPANLARQQALRKLYHLPEKYLLTAGTLEPRKNLPALLKAYTQRVQRDSTTPDLVITGRTGWGTDNLPLLLESLKITERVRLTGFVPDADLPELYRMAMLFLCVSLYEGFGLPILEAMASGTPVVAANNSSIPEVTGDTALLADASRVDDIAAKICEALNTPVPTQHRAQSARLRAETFTWEQTARKTLKAYKQAIG